MASASRKGENVSPCDAYRRIDGLHSQTRETAADIRVCITTDTTEGESFKCEYDRFVRGENTAELMLLEYCGVPPGRGFFDAMDAVISGRLFPIRKMQR